MRRIRVLLVAPVALFAMGSVGAGGVSARLAQGRPAAKPAVEEECDRECQFCKEHATAGEQCESKEKVEEKNAKEEELAAAKAIYVEEQELTVREYEEEVRQITHECSKQGSCKGGSNQQAQLAKVRARKKARLAREKAKYEAEVARIKNKYR
jgi:hypothetical protein